MSAAAIRGVILQLSPASDPPTDGALVAEFAARRDEGAFAELVRRHGPMVLGVCRRILVDLHDAEDAFQAVFFVLAQKAAAVHPPGAVGGWLHGVAVRTAGKARVAAARRRRREMIAAADSASRGSQPPDDSSTQQELRSVLDAELAKMPEAVRAVVVLCDLHGKTRAEAARELGCPEGTIAARLHRGRKALADALARRGLALPAAGLGAVLAPAPVSAVLVRSALALVGGTTSAAVRALAHEVIRSMKTLKTIITLGALTLIAGGLLAAGTLLPREPEQAAKPIAIGAGGANAPVRDADAKRWRETNILEQTGWLVGSVCFSPDGKSLFVGGSEGHTRSYSVEKWKPFWDYRAEGRFAALAAAPDGKTVAVTFSKGAQSGVQIVDAATGKPGDKYVEENALKDWPEPIAVGFFPDQPVRQGNEVIATSRKVIFGNTREYIVKTWLVGGPPSTIKSSLVAAGKQPADEYAVPIAVSPDGKRVVVTGPVDPATGKNVLWAWSAGSGAGNKLLEGHKAAVISAAWSKDGKLIVTGDAQGVVIAWDAATFKEKSRVMFPPGRVAVVAVSDDGKQVAAAVAISLEQLPGKESYSEDVFIWPSDTPPKQPTAISRHPAGGPFKGIASIAFSPDGKTLVSAFCNFVHLSRTGELIGKVRIFTLEASRR